MLPSAPKSRKPALRLPSPAPCASAAAAAAIFDGSAAVEDTSQEAPFNPFGDAPACKSAVLLPPRSDFFFFCVVCLVSSEHLERLRAAAAAVPPTTYNVSEFAYQLTLREQLAAAVAQGGDCLIISAKGTIMDGARALLALSAAAGGATIDCKKLTDELSNQFSFLFDSK
jgi:hypothetical protein